MATAAWLHGIPAMRFTEDLVLFLKEQRPEYLPDVLANYREHGVFPTQVKRCTEMHADLKRLMC